MDALRLLAALAVVFFHFTARDEVRWGLPPSEAFPRLSDWTRYGYAGVHLFFVISGFVVLMSVWNRTVPQFIASRMSRLYPAFWAAVLLTASLRWALPSLENRTPAEVLVNLTMFHEPFGVPAVDGVYWTLWVELQFYIGMAFLIVLGVTRRRVLLVALVIPVICTAVTVLAPSLPGAASRLTVLSWAPMFAAGMVLNVIYRDGHTAARWLLVGVNAAQGILVAATRKVATIDAMITGGRVSPLVLSAVVVAAIGAVAAAALIPAIRDLDWSFLTTMGALTYPLYLTHEYYGWALIQALHPIMSRSAVLLVTIALCLALAWMINRWVERPFQRRFRGFLERVLKRPQRVVVSDLSSV